MTTPAPDAPASTGDGDAGSTGTPGRPHPPKNKECPFCHELFTSSSLGRHLDLYIKDKNPKAADGVHDVEAIRQIRGGITRRQPKRPSNAPHRDGSTPSQPPTAASVLGVSQQQETPSADGGGSVKTPVNGSGYKHLVFNRPTWEATGVMTDIPTVPNEPRLAESMPRRSHKGDTATKRKLVEEHARRRATELALQELVDSVNAVK